MKHNRLRSWRNCLLTGILALACSSQLFALPADIDPSLGIITRTPTPNAAVFESSEVLPDGGLLFAGWGWTGFKGENATASVVRIFPGSLTGPEVDSACWGDVQHAYYVSTALQPDGKLLIAGYTVEWVLPQYDYKYLLVRCNADATLDTSFNGTGIVNGLFGPGPDSAAYRVLVRPNGKILVVGAGNTYLVAQFNSNGTLDTSFGQGGIVENPHPDPKSAALQPDGKLVLAGPDADSAFLLKRLTPNGSTDVLFGRAGRVQTFIGSQGSALNSVKIQPDGKIVAAGDTLDGSFRKIAIARYNPGGSPDKSFGSRGVAVTTFSPHDYGDDVELQSNGKIVVCGNSEYNAQNNFAFFRFYPNGTPDLTFGHGGVAVPHGGRCRNVKLQPNGKIVAVGYYYQRQIALRLKGGERNETVRFDYDGDGKADISGFRPLNSNWNLLRSTSGSTSIHWGLPTDVLVPADYDGDGKTNVAVYRDGAWKIIWLDGTYHQVIHGETDDLPRPGDFDGDGKADIAFWRPSSGNWYWINSSDGQYKEIHFGTTGDVPLIADFDGDGQTEIAVFRPSEGNWYYLKSTTGEYAATHFGTTGDIPVVGDFDGDGKTDLSVFRPSNSFWYRLDSSNGQYFAQKFGTTDDVPVAADYDGDNKSDLAVFRPSNSVWYILKSSNGLTGILYGTTGDRPVPSVFLP